mmetsp:Transcript_74439/g.103431  ORF Transcript_74439/g.103431 Transcript_74439/m.103431 type:complete len:80 (-) Transcript_74439:170-409(-)
MYCCGEPYSIDCPEVYCCAAAPHRSVGCPCIIYSGELDVNGITIGDTALIGVTACVCGVIALMEFVVDGEKLCGIAKNC